jgi:gliding motility-associated-like protein
MTKKYLMLVLLMFTQTLHAQKLIINEVSQGSGNNEYVEFVVVGEACEACVDLRKVILDDNNGYFAAGSGVGIADGAIRFSNSSFWQCVPKGTIIVVYNESSPNPQLPNDDSSLNDGNNLVVIPGSSTLLESTQTPNIPDVSNQNYPLNGIWSSGGQWSKVVMRNPGDSFQVRDSNGLLIHSVSWGDNVSNTIVSFSGSANDKVFSFTNTNSNDFNASSNWGNDLVSNNAETPGLANNTSNDTWINTLLNAPATGIQFTVTPTNTCQNLCNGAASINVTSGVQPYTYLWLNASNTPIASSVSVSSLCPGNYIAVVSSANGCIDTQTVVISNVQQTATIVPAGPFFDYQNPQQLSVTPSGGQWTSSCGNCLDNQGMFNPQIAGEGVFDVCYIVGTGVCSDTSCTSIEVIHCDPINETQQICDGDSILVFNNWIYQTQTLTQQEQTAENCVYTHTVSIVLNDCTVENPIVFIPNVITANGDFLNDTFQIISQGGIVEEGYIFNRWGNVIHTFSETNVSWDGKDEKSGLPVQDGVYTYLIYFKPVNSAREVYNGFVTVIR